MTVIMTLLFAANAFAGTPASAPGDADGKSMFAAKCASCHAKNGKGNPAMAKMFKLSGDELDLTSAATAKKSDADLTAVVAAGRKKMPAFKGKLKDAEISAVVAYVRSLAPAVKPAAPKGGSK